MQITNLAAASIPTTAGGTDLVTNAQMLAVQGAYCIVVNPSVDIALVDNQGSSAAVPGTVANSPFVCPAGLPTVILHRSGNLKAISTSGTATVKVGIGAAP